MAVTLMDIAEAAGKSYTTVSRALSDHPKISKKTKAEICRLAAELGYRPSFAGKALKDGRTRIISVLVPDISDPFYAEFVRNLKIEAAGYGYDIVLYDYEMTPELENRYLELMLTGRCDAAAAFLTSFDYTGELVERMWHMHFPLIAIGTPVSANIHADIVTVDDTDALQSIFAKLAEQGRKHMAVLQEKMSPETFVRLKEILVSRFRDVPLEFDPDRDFFCPVPGTASQAEDGYKFARKILHDDPEIDVIVTSHSIQACGVLRAAAEAGKHIPADLSVITLDNSWPAEYSARPVYSLDQRLDELAKSAFSLLRKRLTEKEWGDPEIIQIPAVVHRI
jgi:DNA-binding LacI/PurR family transcriptional regulator